jgi:ElaB/YqjD/DUF883 family membrane-anchored ribosome-binding protein
MASAENSSKLVRGNVEDVQDDLKSLKNDVGRLAQQVVGMASAKGSEAADAVGEIRDTFVHAFEDSVRERPYTTLALAVGLGFILGAAWRR